MRQNVEHRFRRVLRFSALNINSRRIPPVMVNMYALLGFSIIIIKERTRLFGQGAG